MDALLIALRRALSRLAVLALALAPVGALGQDLTTQARGLLGQGLKPDAAALRLIEQGADPEDSAAALFSVAPDLRAIRAVAFAVVRAGIAADATSAVPLAAGVAGLAPIGRA